MKQMQEAQAKQSKETNTVKSLNEKLNAAKTAADAGDFDTAIAALTEATQMDATRDLIWFKLGDYYRMSAPKQTDPAEKQKRLDSAVDSYQKAVDLKKSTTNDKDPNAAKNLAAYYNNLADAYAKASKIDDAVKTYEIGRADRPWFRSPGILQYRCGSHQRRQARRCQSRPSIKCIAADPTRAEAYYQKGVNLLGKATLQGDKTIAPRRHRGGFPEVLGDRSHGSECPECQRAAGQPWFDGGNELWDEEEVYESSYFRTVTSSRSKGGSSEPPFVRLEHNSRGY